MIHPLQLISSEKKNFYFLYSQSADSKMFYFMF